MHLSAAVKRRHKFHVRQDRPVLPGRAGTEWQIVRRGSEWRERSLRLDAGVGTDSPLTALGEELFERIWREILSLDENSSVLLTAPKLRSLLPLAFSCRAHYYFFRRFIVGLSLKPRIQAPRRSELAHSTVFDAIFSAPRLSVIELVGALQRPSATLLAIARVAPGLVELRIKRSPNLTGRALRGLVLCQRLAVVLIVCCSDLRDDGAEYLVQVPLLRELCVMHCDGISDVFAERIAQAPRLQSLSLGGCVGHLGDAGVLALARSETTCNGLQYLSLSLNRRITDASMSAIGQGLVQIKRLNLEYAALITDEGIATLADGPLRCTLQELYLRGCGRLSPGVANSIAKFEGLTRVTLSNFGDEFVRVISQSCQLLEFFTLTRSDTLTDNGVREIVRLPKLRALHLDHCICLSDALVSILAGAVNAPLELLDIEGCLHVGQQACDGLQAVCKVVRTTCTD